MFYSRLLSRCVSAVRLAANRHVTHATQSPFNNSDTGMELLEKLSERRTAHLLPCGWFNSLERPDQLFGVWLKVNKKENKLCHPPSYNHCATRIRLLDRQRTRWMVHMCSPQEPLVEARTCISDEVNCPVAVGVIMCWSPSQGTAVHSV